MTHLMDFTQSPCVGKKVAFTKCPSTHELILWMDGKEVAVFTLLEAQMIFVGLLGIGVVRLGAGMDHLRSFASQFGFHVLNKTQPNPGEVWGMGCAYGNPVHLYGDARNPALHKLNRSFSRQDTHDARTPRFG